MLFKLLWAWSLHLALVAAVVRSIDVSEARWVVYVRPRMNRDEREAAQHADYIRRQERVFQRRQAAWARQAAAGKTCRLEQCGRHFAVTAEFEVHLAEHKEDLRRRLVCSQEGCGHQLASQKDWREHVEEHKNRLREKIAKSVRCVTFGSDPSILPGPCCY
jgi:hypothetical protein